MMRAMRLRRPVTMKIAVWCEEQYLHWRIKHADRDIAALKEQIDRDQYRLRGHQAYVDELVARLAKASLK